MPILRAPRALAAVVLSFVAAACGPRNALLPQAECFATADCPAGSTCAENLCVPDRDLACDPGRTRCATADLVETCSEAGDGWVIDATPCPGGCDYGRCVARACRPFDLRCNGLTLLICVSDGSRFEFFDQCSFGCSVIDGEPQCTAP